MREFITLIENQRNVERADFYSRRYRSGLSDDALVEFYMEGNCFYLAIALHRITGWPLEVLGGYEDEDQRDDHRTIQFFHVLCRHPSGVMFDINGPVPAEKWLEEWPDCELLPISETQLIEIMSNESKPQSQDLANAKHAVETFLMKKYAEYFK